MPKNITLIRVFVATPSDVKQERESVAKIISELNKTLYQYINCKFEFIGWETNTYPSIGADAQDVINRQIGDEYDVFIGLMWNRFGSPTNREESGTEEEFIRAFNRYKANPSEVKIMFYFKTTPISNEEIDINQLQKLREFKKTLGDKGTYYWTFNGDSDFEELLRIHLSAVAKEFILPNIPTEKKNDTKTTFAAEEELIEEEEVGILENFQIMEETMFEIAEIFKSVTDYTNDLTVKFNERTDEINKISSWPQSAKIKQAVVIADKMSLDMDNFAERTRVEIPIVSEKFKCVMDGYRRAWLSIGEMVSNEDQNLVSEKLQELKNAIVYATGHMNNFGKTIKGFPNYTSKMKKARNRVVKVLSDMNLELDMAIQLIDEVLKLYATRNSLAK